jgi:hypothetical protein
MVAPKEVARYKTANMVVRNFFMMYPTMPEVVGYKIKYIYGMVNVYFRNPGFFNITNGNPPFLGCFLSLSILPISIIRKMHDE